MKVPHAREKPQYLILAAAPNANLQGCIELWIMQSWVPNPQDVLILRAQSRLLLVRVPTIVGVLQVVVAHALDSSYPHETVRHWWAKFKNHLKQLLVLQ